MSLRHGLTKIAVLLLPCLFAVFLAVPAAAKAVMAAQGAPIEIELNKGTLVRLDHAAGTVFIADPEIADIQVKSPTLVYVFAKKVGETTLFAVDEHEHVLLDAPITVTHNLSRLDGALKSLLPDSNISVRSVEGAVVLTGAVANPVEAEDARRLSARFIGKDDEVINRLDVLGANQVNLRVRMAEVSRDALKQLGFNWDAIFNGSFLTAALAIGNPVLAGAQFLRNPDTSVNNLGLSAQNGALTLNTVIDALADEGLVSILAEPNLTAVSGQSANFLAGGEFPVPVPQTGQNGTSVAITIEFKKFGVSLSFTPTVLSNKLISLKVVPEVSQLSDSGSIEIEGFRIPSLTTRRAETTVELGSGQSFAIAGLFQNDTTHNISKFPGLGDLPILGALFRSTKFQRQETELVIVVTPYIVRPVSAMKMALPTDGLVQPNDYERIITGQTYRPQLQQGQPGPVGPDAKGLSGPVGFMLDE
ncbi:MAG TPA: type II and III secretion system protein family protein [Alphaproteobacteria bacterium]|jgi:pilus assembly protein CpaC|nr:type II and III secretion system protein family protein [Alphaproteobacteria bacterium]